jgi:hypothetical protein
MWNRVRRTSPAMIVATIALIVALSGGATGAVKLITGAQIKDGSVTGKDVKNASLLGVDVKDGSLTGKDVKDASLAGVDVADSSVTGDDVKDGSLSPADITGLAPSPFDGSVPSGKTITGAWGDTDLATAAFRDVVSWVSFPFPAPVGLDAEHTKIGTKDTAGLPSAAIAAAAADVRESAACAGNFGAPTAPPGFLCLYVRTNIGGPTNVGPASLFVWPLDVGAVNANRYGFAFEYIAITAAPSRIEGTWAYTAP